MKRKILIVENNVAELKFLEKTLQKEHYETISVVNGDAALLSLEKENPDLAILDTMLPDLDGFELCRRIKKNERFVNLPVLFYTSVRTMDLALIAMEMGASDFISKDASEQELLIRVRNLLNTKKVIEGMVQLSVVDNLTGVYNQTYFQHRLRDEFERGRRYKRDFSCVVLGIDNFKKVNASFGYLTGDNVLKNLAQCVQHNIRRADVLCRYCGDKFGWLLPETEIDGGFQAAERVRQFITTAELGTPERNISLTISCGVSAFTERAEVAENLIAYAEEVLRKAKSEGRNQTRVYE